MTDQSPQSPVPGPGGGQAPDKDSITFGLLCHLLGIFTGFVGPLIIWLLKKDSSPFVNDQGKEALNFQITALIATFACFFGFCFFHILFIAVQLTRIVLSIMATIEASKGVAYRYPITIRFIK